MKYFRNLSKNPLVASFLSGLILFATSCKKVDVNHTGVEVESNKFADYSGEDIFKGLFFFENELSNDISYIADAKEQMLEFSEEQIKNGTIEEGFTILDEMREMGDYVSTFISNNYENFFNNFEVILKSGNCYEIEKQMSIAANLINQACLVSEEYEIGAIVNEELQRDPALKERILSFDLTKKEDQAGLRDLLSTINGLDGKLNSRLILVFIILVVAAALTAAIAVAQVVVEVDVFDLGTDDKKVVDKGDVEKAGPGNTGGKGKLNREIKIKLIADALSI